VGTPEHVYDPWNYPEDWDVEGFSPEGPKVMNNGDYYYLVTAVGGTAGPPTGHMVIPRTTRSRAPARPVSRGGRVATPRWWKAPTGAGG
jgi:xylan 1,4-beta-xylosidase